MGTVAIRVNEVQGQTNLGITEVAIPEVVQEEQVKQKKTRHTNPYKIYFPIFYKKEIRNSVISFIFACIVLFLIFSGIGAAIYFTLNSSAVDPLILLLLIPVCAVTLGYWITMLIRYISFKNESSTINFKDEKVLSINIVRLYKRIKVAYININWLCALSYVIFVTTILVNFIVAKIMYQNIPFGTWDISQVPVGVSGTYIVFEIIFWCSACSCIITIVLHFTLLLNAYWRAIRIENFYNTEIVPAEEMAELKKRIMRRDLIIFLACLAVVGLIVYVIIRLVKRKKTIVVQQ